MVDGDLVGVAGHHHGELFQGAVVRGGEVVSCLITMPVGGVGSRARYVPDVGAGWELVPRVSSVLMSESRVRGGGVSPAQMSGSWAPDGGMSSARMSESGALGGGVSLARMSESGALGGGVSSASDSGVLSACVSESQEPGDRRVSGSLALDGQVSLASASASMLEVIPAWKSKARRAAELALALIGAPVVGRLEIECAVATGVGLGSSTCDVVAAIRAVCSAHGVSLDPGELARLAIEAEGAADPIMFDGEMVLFAQRQGRVLESFGSWSPCYTVVSIDTDAGSAGVDTLSLPPPAYTDAELAMFERLVGRARDAFRQRDAGAIAAIATQSAALNQRLLALRNFHEIRQLADEYGALGVQIAHSGTLAGLLFDPQRVRPDDSLVAQVIDRVRALGLRSLGVFTNGTPGA